jgi:putative transposase
MFLAPDDAMHRPHRLTCDCYLGGHRYSLTICTHDRRPHFRTQQTVDCVRMEFLRTAGAERFAVLAYCFMPDHLHLVINGLEAHADLRRFVRLAKQRTGYHFKQTTGSRLWQDSYFDRTLRHDDELAEVVGYVIDNPVRAGLVNTPEAYPFWGSQVSSRQELLDFIADYSPRV